MGPLSEKVEFRGAAGDVLAARLDLPIAPPLAYALFAHCFTCSKDTRASTYVSAALAESGIAVLRFDFTGLGGSSGDFGNSNFSSNVGDLIAAADFLRSRYRAPEILIGHSLGGTAVLAAAAHVPEARAVATIGAPFDPAHIIQQFVAQAEQIRREGEATVTLAGRSFRIKQQFLDDVTSRSQADVIATLGKALLVMHSPRDSIVEIENATRIFVAAKHPKSFVSLDPADHLLSRREDAAYAGHVLASWAARYIAARVPAALTPIADQVVVGETREGKFTQQIVAGRHVFRSDEPFGVGGLDSGPAPYDLLLAGLGACTSMTLRLYADLKKIPLERITVTLRHDRIHAQDCATCETSEAKIDRVERVVHLEGQLDAGQRAKLLEIADKCPVHRTLQAKISMTTRLD
jgi:uncharacterized OsmC-like protein/fermentation-respiration switch protein FrsA (DUF1100 family)